MSRHTFVYLSLVAILSLATVRFAQSTPNSQEALPSKSDSAITVTTPAMKETANEWTRPVALVALQTDANDGNAAAVPEPVPVEDEEAGQQETETSDEVLGCCCETVCELRCVRVGLFKLRKRLCLVPVTSCSLCPIHSSAKTIVSAGEYGESIRVDQSDMDALEKAPLHSVEELPAPKVGPSE